MAFATKYSVTWKDIEDVTWEVYFQEDGFGGSITELTPGQAPAIMTYNSTDKYEPIVGCSVDVQMVYESEIDSLYTEESQSIKVLLRRDSTTIFAGFVLPAQYFRQFNKPKHYATITATDGLGNLKNIKFEDGSGDPYFGQQTEITAIANILAKTGTVPGILDSINIFDTNHTTGAAYSPLNQTYIYPEAYWDEQTDERSDCYTVLYDILKKYGAQIRQYNGWIIIRPNSFSLDTIYHRTFLGATYITNSSYTSYVSVATDPKYIYSDQEIRKRISIGSCDVTQNPPRRSNHFKNGSFDSFTWTGGIPDYWTDVESSGTNLDISNDGGTLKLGANGNAATPTEYIETTIEIHDPTSMSLTFDWTPTYTGSPSYKSLFLQIYDGAYYYTTSGWQSGVGYYTLLAPALSSGFSLKGNIDIPAQFAYGYNRSFSLRIRIYEFHNENAAATNYVNIDNLRLDAPTDKSASKLHTYENSLSVNSNEEIEIASGDSWITDYFPSATDDASYFITTYSAGTDLTTSWSITGDPTAGAPIGEVLARQTVEGYRRSLDVLSGTLRGTSTKMGYLAIEDANITDEYGFAKHFYPMGVSLNTRENEWNGEWIECPATYGADEALEWASSDYDYYNISTTQIEVSLGAGEPASAGDGTATSDTYTAVAGENAHIILTLTNTGGDLPSCTIGGVSTTVAWGVNYLRVRFPTAGAKAIVLGGDDPGDNHTYTATINAFYPLTGV